MVHIPPLILAYRADMPPCLRMAIKNAPAHASHAQGREKLARGTTLLCRPYNKKRRPLYRQSDLFPMTGCACNGAIRPALGAAFTAICAGSSGAMFTHRPAAGFQPAPALCGRSGALLFPSSPFSIL